MKKVNNQIRGQISDAVWRCVHDEAAWGVRDHVSRRVRVRANSRLQQQILDPVSLQIGSPVMQQVEQNEIS